MPEHFGHYTDPQGDGFLELFATVVGQLPSGAREKLESYWNANTITLPELPNWPKGPQLSPVVIVGQDWTASTRQLDDKDSSLAVNMNGRLIIFDASFLKAPPVVASTLMAHEIGHSYQYAKYGKPPDDFRTAEREVNRFLRKWGYDENDIELWQGALSAIPDNPVPTFYAYRFHKRGHKPPDDTPREVIDEIRKVLIDKGSPKANEL